MAIWEKIYSLIGWENQPSTKTPVSASNLNKMDVAINELDDRVLELKESGGGLNVIEISSSDYEDLPNKENDPNLYKVKDADEYIKAENVEYGDSDVKSALETLSTDLSKLGGFTIEVLTIPPSGATTISNPGGLIKSRCFAFLQIGKVASMYIAYYDTVNANYRVAPIETQESVGFMDTNSSGQLALWNSNADNAMRVTLIFL